MPKINPNILIWARETAGLSLEEAAQKIQLKDVQGMSGAERLANLEAGKNEPTRPLLVKMAKQYRRPLLVFYMSSPPRTGDRGQDFRTLPEKYSSRSNALVDTLIRDIQTRQSLLRTALEDEEEAKELPFVNSMKTSDGVPNLVASIRSTINVTLDDYRNQPSKEDAFSLLRAGAEAAGVFVLLIGNLGSHHTAIDVEVFRGFALADKVAPFIVINDQDSKAAWSFTLIHELTHIWLGQTGISNAIVSGQKIEQFCNEVASEYLLPSKEIDQLSINGSSNTKELKMMISAFADERNLSSSMIAYKLFRKEIISEEAWLYLSEAYRNQWNQFRTERRSKVRTQSGGQDYYVVRKHRIGIPLISLVKRMMEGGTLTTSKGAKVLGIKAKNVQKLLETSGLTNSSQTV